MTVETNQPAFCVGCKPWKTPRALMCERCRARLQSGEKRRYEQARLGTPRIGDQIECLNCFKPLTRTAPLKKYCAACAPVAISRAALAKKAKAKGTPRPGDLATCAYCHAEFKIDHWKRKFCDPCRAGYASTKMRLARLRRTDPAFVVSSAIRSSIYGRLKRKKGGKRWKDLLGYSPDELKIHLERQFTKGMSWENYGLWHIDHIIPLASFSFETVDDPEFKRAWSLPNLRPLWAKENMKKRADRTLLC